MQRALFSEDECVPDSPRIAQLWARHFNTSEEELPELMQNTECIDFGDSFSWLVERGGVYYQVSYGPEPAHTVYEISTENRMRSMLKQIVDSGIEPECLRHALQALMPVIQESNKVKDAKNAVKELEWLQKVYESNTTVS